MNDMNKIMQQAQQVQKNIQEAQGKIAQMQVMGKTKAGPGLVKIIMTGQHVAKSCSIDDSVLKGDKETLEELIVEAINDAVTQIETKSRELMMSLMSGMNLPKELGGE